MRNNLERLGAVQQSGELPPQMQNAAAEQQPSQALNFIVPTEYVALPSKGRFYPQNHPLHGKDVIEIKQMTAKEEDILTSRNLLKKGVALDKLIQALVVDKSINTDSLTVEDRGAIVLAARISAYGAEYATTVTCPSCNEKNKNKFDLLEKLDAVETLQPVEVDANGLFTVVLPKTGWTVKCRALNGYDEKAMLRISESKKNLSDGDSLVIDQLKMTIVSINDVTDKNTIEAAINSMPARDSKHIRTVYQDTLKGVDMRHTFSCKSCDYSGELEVPLTADFFWFK
jgi:transcription elongation factor Elf1